jgi:predicted outer membrane repeat protein
VNNTFTETTSLGYNVVNAASGTGTTQCGWTFITGDKQISSQPVSAVSFRLLSGSDAAGVMSALPSGYPAFDFYGDPVTAPAAAGAVQSSGYELTLSVNNSTQGSVSVTSAQPADGLYSTVTITAASAGYALSRWQIDGVESGNTNPLTITLTANTNVQAVFGRLLIVDNFSDASGSETTAGTLRYALTDMEDFDVIRLSGVTPGETVIELTSQLDIRTGITIEGNGVTLTQGSEWTGSSSMMYVGTVSVAISRVWFKDGRATSTYSSAGLETNGNQLTLESCIFSGNQASGTYGGAIYNGGKLNVKGCTFYGNSSRSGGAIYFFNNSASSTLTLTGSLFYENTASEEYPVVRPSATVPVTSTGYNVVDVALGTGTDQCGWASGVTGDQYRAASPFTSAETLAPVSGLRSVIPQTFAANMPATDFYGEMRTYPSAPGAVK